MTPTVTTIAMAALTVAIIAWDVYLWRDSRDGNTVSEVMQLLDPIKMLVVFGFGLLCGHWWW